MTIVSHLIDTCSEYVEDKDAHYLAKEGYIVYYASTTGRKQDYYWQKQTITETIRIIRAMKLTAEKAAKLKESHLIAAFQELGRVYEFGVKSPHAVRSGLFNYNEHCEMSLGDVVVSRVVETLQKRGYMAVLMKDVMTIIATLNSELKLGLGPREARTLLIKHAETAGYNVKTGSRRPLIEGSKQNVLMMPMTKPAEVSGLERVYIQYFIEPIYKELR